ncbi:transcription initiation factor TFIID subunit 5 isoform X1 [Drosophila persimilis]|uniref:transcription initiation factor TFIID subunit 5 isoform X1 n=1 Tax=Drosophila persimilis TaxID=7234 RepID=UPI000F093DD8|nr:transcription initiation factor TFIID subunit 5 isoform X1 [Drosophila persimilis]
MKNSKVKGPSGKKIGGKGKINPEQNRDQVSVFSSEFFQVLHDIKNAVELSVKATVEKVSSNDFAGNSDAGTSMERIEVYKRGKDFYEGNAIVIRPAGELLNFAGIKDEEILLEYEEAFRCTQKIVDAVPSYHKYEIFLMLYPMLTFAYLQMVMGEKLERATCFLKEAATCLDESYSRRIDKLKLIRKPDDLPGRALELLAGADTVAVAMARPTYLLYINCVTDWTRGQQEKLLRHFAIRSYNDEDPLQESTLPGLPQLEPLVNSSVDLPNCLPLDRDNRPMIFNFAAGGGDAKVLCCTPSGDLSMVAIGLSNNNIRVTVGLDKISPDSNCRRDEKTLSGHKEPVLSLAFAPQNRFLLSSSRDFTMRLWCVISWTCATVYSNHLCTFVAFAPRGFIFAGTSDDGIVRLWGSSTKKPFLQLAGHLADMEVCLFHSNSQYLVTGSADCTVRMWDIKKGLQVRLFRGHKYNITALAFSKCGRYLISGGHDCLIIVWDTDSGRMVRTLKHHTSVINSIAVNTENNMLAVGDDTDLSFWDLQLLVKNYNPNPGDKESSAKPSLKKLLYGFFDNLNGSLRCLRFVCRNSIMAICSVPTE